MLRNKGMGIAQISYKMKSHPNDSGTRKAEKPIGEDDNFSPDLDANSTALVLSNLKNSPWRWNLPE